MASIYDLKPHFQGLLRPIVKKLAAARVTANDVTLAAAVLSLAAGVLVYFFHSFSRVFLLIPIVLFVRMALNAIDGMLAREHDMKSSLGAILNELGDVFSDTFLYLPLATLEGVSEFLVVALVVLAVISEMTGVVAVQIGASRRYDGPMGKSDRAFWIGAITLAIGLGVRQGLWLNLPFATLGILLIVTIMNRGRKALKELEP